VTIVSVALALLILVISEIIPKTIGAVHGRKLIVPIVFIVDAMIKITLPLVWVLNRISRVLRGKSQGSGLSRESIAVIAELARTEGALIGTESELIRNVLRLGQVRVRDVMTPRTVVFMVHKDAALSEVASDEKFKRFTRIPIYDESQDDIVGVALKGEIYEAMHNGQGDRKVATLARRIHAVPETSPVLRILEEFGRVRHHLFLVVDEFGGTAGIITLEDCIESVIGREIVDETDSIADMRRLASTKK
jgi:CBS domain containing-hemolysin-like protein